jgi:hypothetical protein
MTTRYLVNSFKETNQMPYVWYAIEKTQFSSAPILEKSFAKDASANP